MFLELIGDLLVYDLLSQELMYLAFNFLNVKKCMGQFAKEFLYFYCTNWSICEFVIGLVKLRCL